MPILAGCKRLTCEFDYYPSIPCVGEEVTFSNHSTGSDDYLWSFGDNSTSESNSPIHVYKKAGTYTVRLQVIRNKVEKKVRTHTITIRDTIPTIGISPDTLYTYTPVRLSAYVYNPWGKVLHYSWRLPAQAVALTNANADTAAVKCYFVEPCQNAELALNLSIGEQLFPIVKYVDVHHQPASSLLVKAGEQMYEQFRYVVEGEQLYSAVQPTELDTNSTILANEQDTVYHHGDSLITVSRVSQMISQTIQGFQADRLAGKIYAYGNGLWVCAINGKYVRQLAAGQVTAIKVDVAGNRLYWATAEGVKVHPLLQTVANTETFAPVLINDVQHVTRLAVNTTKH